MPIAIDNLRSSLRELGQALNETLLADAGEQAAALDELEQRIADVRRAAAQCRRAQEPGQPR